MEDVDQGMCEECEVFYPHQWNPQRVDSSYQRFKTRGSPVSFPFPVLIGSGCFKSDYYKRVEGNIIDSFRAGRNEVALSHLQFVDATMLFCSGKEESFLILNHMVAFFEDLSG